jgi:putative ABC transport system ATP-binding protein
LLSGLKSASSGQVFIGDYNYTQATPNQRLDFRRKYFGFVFQQPFLIPYLTILENVLVPIEQADEEDQDRALELLEALGVAELATKFPNECSGGERVRASMARGLVHRPQYLFVDEPTANLDSVTSARAMKVLRSQCEHGTLIVVTHDLEILDEADIVFRFRDGRMTESFVPQRLTA